MKIEIVQLENIRSHVKSTVPFARGFNCLVGGVGCGKSSILYSIDFALFGDPIGRSYEYLLREGADSGKVTIQFTQNGKTYKMIRGLRKRGKGIGQDADELKFFEGESLISSVKSEAVTEQFKAITGFDKELFREIVWVRQERLKELLDAAPRERQKRMDEMFGLSDYEVAWSNLVAYQRDYEVEKKVFERDPDVTGVEKLGAEYSRIVEEFSLVEIELQDMAGMSNAARKTVEEADSRLKELESTRTQNEELKRKETRLAASLVSAEDTIASTTNKIGDIKATAENLKKRFRLMEAQTASFRADLEAVGLPLDQSVDDLSRQLAAIEDRISGMKGEQEAAHRSAQQDNKRLSSLEAESKCPLCLQPLTEEYKNDLVQRIHDENVQRENLLGQLQRGLEELQRVKSKAGVALSGLQSTAPRFDDLKARIGEESVSLDALARELNEKEGQRVEILAQLDVVRAEISRFDVSGLEAAKARRDEAYRHYYLLDSEMRTRENRKKDLTKRLDEVKDRIDQAQRKIERMEQIAKAIGILGDIRDAFRGIQPKLRAEFVKVLRSFVQQVLDSLVGGEGPLLNVAVDETYTPLVKSESGAEREVAYLSGGERTLLAFAYRLGLGQLIMQSRTGHGLSMLLLDEPTESLGREDGSIDRLAEAISRFKAVEQIIAVTHSEAFAEKAEHVVRIEKEAGQSRVSVER